MFVPKKSAITVFFFYFQSPVEYEADSYGIPQYQPLKQEYQESAPYQV